MKKRIFVVDDEWAILELLRIKLTERGADVMAARNKNEFFERVFAYKPHLIILDIWLGSEPGGTEIYNDALARGFNPEVPVIFFSGLVQEGTPPKRASIDRRFSLYGKPFDFDIMIEDIFSLMDAIPKAKVEAG